MIGRGLRGEDEEPGSRRSIHLADTPTRANIERRTAEGKSPREIRRCLKRFIARQIFRQLQTLVA